MAKRLSKDKEQKVLQHAHDSIYKWFSYFSENLDSMRDDRYFVLVSQWDNNEIEELQRLQKPQMQWNKLYDYVKKIVGEQRMNTPNIVVRGTTDEVPAEEVALRADLIKDIAYNSKNDVVYQTAFQNALIGGFGAWRIKTDYESEYSFNQKILLEAIPNPERAFWDPLANDPTKCDGDFCGCYVTVPKEMFEEKYPDIELPISYPSYGILEYFDWGSKDFVTVVDFYKKEWYRKRIFLLDNGQVVDTKELKKIEQAYEDYINNPDIDSMQQPMEFPQVVDERTTADYKIMHYKLIHGKILEYTEWPSKELPIVFVDGDSNMIDGEQRTKSFVKFAKDAQRFMNLCGVEIAQRLKMSRSERFMGTPSNVKGNEIVWRNPENQQGILLAVPDPKTGMMPQPIPPQELPASFTQQFQRAENDIASILGRYDANQGRQGQEISGVALETRIRQGNTSTFVYFDNLNRGIEQTGRIIMDMLPRVYDTERRINLPNDKGDVKNIVINQVMPDGSVKNDLTRGEFSVHVDVGPSFAAQKEQALQTFVELTRINPQTFPLVADLIAENLDLENVSEVVERFKTLVPPNIKAMEEGKPPPPPAPNPMAQLAQQKMQLEAEQLDLKKREQQLDMLKLQLEQDKMVAEGQSTRAKADAEIRKAQLDHAANVADATAKIFDAQTRR